MKEGKIKPCWFVTCGVCGIKLVSFKLTSAEVINDLRYGRWQKTKEHGWTCPKHFETETVAEEAEVKT